MSILFNLSKGDISEESHIMHLLITWVNADYSSRSTMSLFAYFSAKYRMNQCDRFLKQME